jgi:Protein of unknown function (DUF1064)
LNKKFTLKDIQQSKVGHLNKHLVNDTPAKEKKSKYGNRKVEFEGQVFDSKKELARWLQLRMRVLAGEITDLRRQVEYVLKVEGEKVCIYWADFVYIENGVEIVEDVKSKITRTLPVYRLKKKLMKSIFKIEIKET